MLVKLKSFEKDVHFVLKTFDTQQQVHDGFNTLHIDNQIVMQPNDSFQLVELGNRYVNDFFYYIFPTPKAV